MAETWHDYTLLLDQSSFVIFYAVHDVTGTGCKEQTPRNYNVNKQQWRCVWYWLFQTLIKKKEMLMMAFLLSVFPLTALRNSFVLRCWQLCLEELWWIFLEEQKHFNMLVRTLCLRCSIRPRPLGQSIQDKAPLSYLSIIDTLHLPDQAVVWLWH